MASLNVPSSTTRQRANSVKEAIDNIETDPAHHLAGPFNQSPPTPSEPKRPSENQIQRHASKRNRRALSVTPAVEILTKGLWKDITSMNWTRVPSSALVVMAVPIVLWFNWQIFSPNVENPFIYLFTIQHKIPGEAHYAKGWGDLAFLAYYVVVFSFLRQLFTLHVFRPMAIALGIKRMSKIDRFAEQGYAIVYWSTSGLLGLWAMRSTNTWYFEGRHFFQDYPYWKLTSFMKSYYLLQFSYWLQQFLVLILGLEKPRKDFKELVAHHIVTLWLIGWSYLTSQTPIGNAVFITMDISDVFLALTKILNYLGVEKTANTAFAFFVGVWTYTRHYLNLYILYAVWVYFDLTPEHAKQWAPEQGVWMAPWMKYQILAPLILLQAVNLFWYYLIWRVLIRAVFSKLEDERSDDEDDGKPDEPDEKDD